MSTDGGTTWAKMPNYAPPAHNAVRISASIAGPTALYSFINFPSPLTAEQILVCSPISINCNFVALTTLPKDLVNQPDDNIVVFADPNNATRAYVGGLLTYLRVENVNFVTGSATYTSIVGAGFTSDGSAQHPDGRILVLDANKDLLQGDFRFLGFFFFFF